MKKKTEDKTTKKTEKRRLLRTGVGLIVVLVLLIGFSYAWFINRNDITTLMEIQEPSEISILGSDGKRLDSLDLTYQPGEKNADGTVTIRRVFCVQSATNYKLELVHTTNLKGLTFTLYPAVKAGATGAAGTSVTDGDTTFSYDSSAKIGGAYINLTESTGDYKYANAEKHSQNYQEYQQVQAHAEPAYWLAKDTQDFDKTGSEPFTDKNETYYRNYYVCEVTWTETKEKETDIFYILAKGA